MAGKPTVLLDMSDDPELHALLGRYKKASGWTWKRMFLIGFANTVAKQGDNPDLVVRIADYLEGRRGE